MHQGKLSPRPLPVEGDPCLVPDFGFLGLIRPGHELLHALGLLFGDPRAPGHNTGKSSEGHLTSPWSGSPNSTRRGHLLPPEPGIRNPTVCLQVNDTLAFLVTREHYPEYDL
uniref:Uncharacterized protein n=1 Tax=Mustela putorius furo TaxID=9669 RepID=M3XWC0_MUSPF